MDHVICRGMIIVATVKSRGALDQACGAWMNAYEEEMAGIFDIQGEAKYLGKADEPSFAWEPAIKPVRGNAACCRDQAYWRWLADRFV